MDDTRLQSAPLQADELRDMDRYWRACNYLSAGMIYLRANPLLREPLAPEHIKRRLLGHWGSDPGQSFVLAHSYLEGRYSEIYPDRGETEEGMGRLFKLFSFPGGIGSHCTPETPGSIHEG